MRLALDSCITAKNRLLFNHKFRTKEAELAKIVDYPRCSLRNALELAKGVEGLGGSASVELAAESLGKKVGGAFNAQIGGTSKHGLIANEKGTLKVTELYKQIELAYDEEESQRFRRQAFLNPPLFQDLYDRYKGRKLPTDLLDKIMIREFSVPKNISSRIAGYFVEGAKQVGLIGPEDQLIDVSSVDEDQDDSEPDVGHELLPSLRTTNEIAADEYAIHIIGPGVNSTIKIREEDDLAIVDAMLAKIRKKVGVIEA